MSGKSGRWTLFMQQATTALWDTLSELRNSFGLERRKPTIYRKYMFTLSTGHDRGRVQIKVSHTPHALVVLTLHGQPSYPDRVLLGDAAFDAAFVVRGGQAMVLEVMTLSVREAFMRCAQRCNKLQFRNQRFVLEGVDTRNPDELHIVLDHLVELIERLKHRQLHIMQTSGIPQQ
ncbi:MAG: hypothetical protein AAFS10_01495 [Myxococcota bacterium]